MPAYPWLFSDDLDTSLTMRKLEVMKQLGVPYSEDDIRNALSSLKAQAEKIRGELAEQGAPREAGIENKEIIALVAYLQRLGTDIKGGQK